MPDDDELQSDRPDGLNQTPSQDAGGDSQAAEQDAGREAESDAEGTDATDEMPEPRPLSVVARNVATLGQLTLHYPSRDVTVLLDGDAAMRTLTMFEQRREGGLADLLDPEMSEAEAGWVVLDLDEPLAMSWMPGLPRKRPRTAIDPALPVVRNTCPGASPSWRRPKPRGHPVSGPPWRRRLSIDWQAALLNTVLNVVLLAVLAAPVAVLVTALVEVAHRADARVPALAYGAVWALIYAAGLVRAFAKVELEFSPRR